MNYTIRLKEVREYLGYSQKDFATFLNLEATLYNKYEKNYNILPIKHLISICLKCHVSIDYLFGFSDEFCYSKEKKSTSKEMMGKRLKEFRKENKLTQENLAHILHTTHSVISDYEHGRYYIATPFLYMISKTFSISSDYLLGFTNQKEIIKETVK